MFQTPDGNRIANEIRLSVDSSEKMSFSNFNTISNPLGTFTLFGSTVLSFWPFS